jgi:hypothetical protein
MDDRDKTASIAVEIVWRLLHIIASVAGVVLGVALFLAVTGAEPTEYHTGVFMGVFFCAVWEQIAKACRNIAKIIGGADA